MRVSRTRSVVAALLLLAGSPVQAQAVNDVRCLLASNLFSMAGKEDKTRKLADSNKFFYLGRVSARLSEQQIRTQMIAEGKMITAANAGKVMDACAGQMRNAANEVEAIGKQVAPRKK
jgi:hypothetical protein